MFDKLKNSKQIVEAWLAQRKAKKNAKLVILKAEERELFTEAEVAAMWPE